MIGLGTIINSAAIVAAGLIGINLKNLMSSRMQESLTMGCGISVLFIGIAGTLEKMFVIEETSFSSEGSMIIIISLALGAIIGELIDIEGNLERFGDWLKNKTGNNNDSQFINAFVTASLTVCIGAMAIVGAIEDALFHDLSILLAKAILDLIIIAVMSSSMGIGAMFSFIPVLFLQGTVTLLAGLIEPVLTPLALNNLSMVGSILIFCVGVNLVWGKKIRVASLLPALIFAVIFAFL